jgi:anhydro-N-acetylmuramic acid kinase
MNQQIISALPKNSKTDNTLLVTGGGARNRFWMERLMAHLPTNFGLHIPGNDWIDFKEALVFAFMAVLRQRNEINILKSVTGAQKNSCGGDLFLPTRA